MPINHSAKPEPTALEKLQDLLRTLFQFELSDLDFGIYRLFRLKQEELKAFIEKQLPQTVDKAFAEMTGSDSEQLSKDVEHLAGRIRSEVDPDAILDSGVVRDEVRNIKAKAIKELIAEYETKKSKLDTVHVTEEQKRDVFNHLYNFFSRYYDACDFIPRRFYGARTQYAVPYSGAETHLHWANKDQHYVKTGEAFRDYAFTVDALGGPFRVRFVITSANVPKDNTKGERRYFFPLSHEITYDTDSKTLRVPFHYRLPIDAELKSGGSPGSEDEQAKKLTGDKLQDSLLRQVQESVLSKVKDPALVNRLAQVVNEEEVERDGAEPVTLLLKRLRHFAKRNTTDYFIHKNLKIFLTTELEFYIKDQILHLGDIEGDLESKCRMLRAFRHLANDLITFLSQIEDVQLRLFEKRKFVLRTDYLVTIANIPKDLRKEILDPKRGAKQLAEWKFLYQFGECAELLDWKGKITEPFLDKHATLVVNTANFEESFKQRLIESFADLKAVTDGIVINSENYQALRFIERRLYERVKCIYIDPPYNRDSDDFIYKDRYRHSSWIAMLTSRLAVARSILSKEGVIFSSIDENERANLEHVLNSVFGEENRVEELIWAQNTTHSQSPTYSTNHEYVEVFARNKQIAIQDPAMFREPKPGFVEIMEVIETLNPKYPPLAEIESEIKALMAKHLEEYKEELNAMGLEYDDDTKKQDPWRGIYPYWHTEYRDVDGRKVEETNARKLKARIRLWQEGDASAPAGKQSETTKDPKHLNYRFYKPLHPVTKKKCPHPKRGWGFPYKWDDDSRENFVGFDLDDRIVWGEDETKVPRYKRFLHEVETNVSKSVIHDYTDGEKQVANLFGRPDFFRNPKPTTLIERFILQTCQKGDWVADFFVGSGTTAQAVINVSTLLRAKMKFFVCEMGKHFDTVLLPRIQKVIFTSHWQDGKPKVLATKEEARVRPCLVKVIKLESYEDALQNCSSADTVVRSNPRAAAHKAHLGDESYRLKYLASLPVEESASMLQLDNLQHPFGYTLEVLTDNGPQIQAVDLIETFNYLLGLDVQRLERWENTKDTLHGEPRLYRIVKGRDRSGKRFLVLWRDMTNFDPQVEREFLEARLKLEKEPFDRMLINGDTATPGFQSLDSLFKQLMTE